MRGYILAAALLLLLLLIPVSLARASPIDKATYELKVQPYAQDALHDANQKWDPSGDGIPDPSRVTSSISGWAPNSNGSSVSNPGAPKFWLGNSPVGITLAQKEDLLANLLSDWDGCFDFYLSGFDLDPWDWDVDINYWWPIQVVHTHPLYQNRYLPKAPPLYPTWYQQDMFAQNIAGGNMFTLYDLIENFSMPNAVGHAMYQAQWKLYKNPVYAAMHQQVPIPPVPALMINPANPFNPSSPSAHVDLDGFSKRHRYIGGGGQGSLNQLDYSLMPSLLQGLWAYIANYVPFLKLIPCTPSKKLPWPVSSDDPLYTEIARDPLSTLLMVKDKGLQDDWDRWIDDPDACMRYKMHTSKTNIPYDMYKSPNLSIYPDLIEDFNMGKISKYDRMCTQNWGATFPYTVGHATTDHDIVSAGINFEKAIRLSNAYFRTMIQPTGAMNWLFTAYAFDKSKDKIQYTYHDRAPQQCSKVGKPFPDVNKFKSYRKEGEYGLYSITHWKKYKCEVSINRGLLLKALDLAFQGFGPIIQNIINGLGL